MIRHIAMEKLAQRSLGTTCGAVVTIGNDRLYAAKEREEVAFVDVTRADLEQVIAVLCAKGYLTHVSSAWPTTMHDVPLLLDPATALSTAPPWILACSGELLSLPSTTSESKIRRWVTTFIGGLRSQAHTRLLASVMDGQADLAPAESYGGLSGLPSPPDAPATADGTSARDWSTYSESDEVGRLKPVIRVHSSNVFGTAVVHTKAEAACSPNSLLLDDRPAGHAVSLEREQSRVRAVGEAYERYAAGVVDRSDVTFECLNNLDGEVVHPDDIICYRQWQYAIDTSLRPFDPSRPLAWVQGRTTAGSPIWLLADCVFYPWPKSRGGIHTTANSSGMAAHRSRESAIESAWAELVERDAFMRTWLSGRAPARLRMSELSDAYRHMAQDLRSRSWNVHLLHLGLDDDPVVGAIAENGRAVALGASAGPPLAAASKALQECWSVAMLASDSDHTPENAADVRTPADHRRWYRFGDHLEDVEWLWSGGALVHQRELSVEVAPPPQDAAIYEWPHRFTTPLSVVRVVHRPMIPITFGWGREPLGRADAAALVVASSRSADAPLPVHPFP